MSSFNKSIITNIPYTTINIYSDIKSIFETDDDVNLINNIDYPKCSIGFQHYIHSLRKDKEALKQFENKKKVYLVTNEFELEIDNYDDSIKKNVYKFLNLKDTQILSLDFYKFWEIFFMFDIIDNTKQNKTLIMADDGSVSQSVLFFREKYSKEYKSDITDILKIDNTNLNVEIQQFNKNLIDNQKNKKLDIKTENEIKDKYDLILGCGNIIETENENTFEQDYFNLLFIQLTNAFKHTKKNGNFVVKIYESFTNITSKIIAILISSYEKIFIVKPLTSKSYVSDRYLVCIGFKGKEVDIKKIEKIKNKIFQNNKLKIVDIFTKYEINKELKLKFIQMNIHITNNIFKSVGKMINFINSQNFYGDEYQNYREKQIESTKYWINTFLPDIKDYKENKKKITDNSILSNKIIMDDMTKLNKVIKQNN
jgi:23S rRNA U2552 (ribose-2'-O)-methylase RlmE/FtsJ